VRERDAQQQHDRQQSAMKVAILAGGVGSRLVGETGDRPKPLVEIGGQPILVHIMRYYAHHGFDQFVVALGHRGALIAEVLAGVAREFGWRIEAVETGDGTQTGGRIKRLAPHLGSETFMLTWSDGLSDIDLRATLAFHRAHGKLATVTAVHPPPRFGRLRLEGDRVADFAEKPPAADEWVNGAFFVLEPRALDYIEGDDTVFERAPLERLARDGELMAYRHASFWQCMDTAADRHLLEALWRRGRAPWKVWE
jgi:glucose-1-phosphate cytidylyltransferase